MAKGKNRKPRPNPQASSPQNGAKNEFDKAKSIAEESANELISEGIEVEVVSVPASDATHSRLVQVNQEALTAKLGYEKLKEKLNEDRNKFESEKEKFLSESEEVKMRASNLDVKLKKFESDMETFQKENEKLVALKADAEVGFLSRRDEILGPIQERITELSTAWHDGELERIKDWSTKLKEQRDLLDLDHKNQVQRLRDEENRLSAIELDFFKKENELTKRFNQLEIERESLNDEVLFFNETKKRQIQDAQREVQDQLTDSEESNRRLIDRIRDLEKNNKVVDELTQKFGKDPGRLLRDYEDLSVQLRGLQSELSIRPGIEIVDELSAAMQRTEDALKDKNTALHLQRQLQSQLDYQTSQLEELDRLKLTKETLEMSVEAYKVEIKSFRDQLGQLQADRESKTAFPECTRIDMEFEKKSPIEGLPVGDLEEFIEDLQSRMALDKDAAADGKQLNYRASDLRIFLAGLAMSKLHLLEGVSGTGKTTLPNAFANALGGSARKVEVQAGWRDKQDLLGYYNSFERVYRETPCLQYLYKAGIPFFSDQIIFIVLDEMNLSHPEQYFADFLSALEDPRSQPLVSISDRGLPEVPRGMIKTTGVQLKLPSNVWFIGTANQDETTFAFAPKTYDRAHVMELKPNAPMVSPKAVPERKGYISVTELMKSFDAASNDYAEQTRKIQSYVHELSTVFKEKFRVSWGNRLDLHISRFAPVDIAAGGSVGEALDYIIATKVLQKVKGKHSIRVDDLEELRELIQDTWIDDLSKHGPDRSLEVIDEEIKELRLG